MCPGRWTVGDSGSRRFEANNFVTLGLRLPERSDDCMSAFARKAEAVTGLTIEMVTWDASPVLAY